MLRVLMYLLAGLASMAALAADGQQDLNALYADANRYLNQQLAQYGDQASYQLGRLDPRLSLDACRHVTVELAAGYRLIGNVALRVRCARGAHWTINIPVAVSIHGTYLVASRPIPPGQPLTASDMETRTGELADLPSDIVRDPSQAVGQTLPGGAQLGTPLRLGLLHPPFAVRANDIVKVVARGAGFEVSGEGRALGNADVGGQVEVKMASGRVVQGTARDTDVVDIQY